VRRPTEPFFWSLFSAGGTLAALVFPALVFLLFVAGPAGWVELPPPEVLLALARPLLARIALAGLVALGLFHWAHRFRYTLYDGLQLHHLYGLIAAICYGGATAGTLAAVWVAATLP
jgi:fumarate reductase subunit D